MKRSKLIGGVLIVVLAAFFLVTCSSNSGDEGGGNTRKEISKTLLDEDTVWSIDKGIIIIYNKYLADAYGNIMIADASCPGGGIVDIVGTTSYERSTDTVTVDLSFIMVNCTVPVYYESEGVDLTVNGLLAWSGTWSNSTNLLNLNFQSTDLIYNGSDHRTNYLDTKIDGSGSYSSTFTKNDTSNGSFVGVVNGSSVSWTFNSDDQRAISGSSAGK
jgi:hypothetical protein